MTATRTPIQIALALLGDRPATIAANMAVSRTTVRRWLSGETRTLTVGNRDRLRQILTDQIGVAYAGPDTAAAEFEAEALRAAAWALLTPAEQVAERAAEDAFVADMRARFAPIAAEYAAQEAARFGSACVDAGDETSPRRSVTAGVDPFALLTSDREWAAAAAFDAKLDAAFGGVL